jgi:hypothetical protein
MRRLLLIFVIAIGLAPGTLLRTATNSDPDDPGIVITPIAERDGLRGALTMTGAWEITSTHDFFGGFSALETAGPTRLLAGSDRAWLFEIPLLDGEPDAGAAQLSLFAARSDGIEPMFDLEALARDPVTGTLWAAYENANALERITPDGTRTVRRPPEMRRWSANSGAETMVRLADGSFIVLAEAPEVSGRRDRPGLLYFKDPVSQTDPVEFRISTPRKYSPVDATALPDGTVLILLRRVQVSVPAAFDVAVMHADPARIVAGGIWTGEVLAYLDGPVFAENFEGITFVPTNKTGSKGDIYLISDDNFSVFQRNLLVRLAWPAKE